MFKNKDSFFKILFSIGLNLLAVTNIILLVIIGNFKTIESQEFIVTYYNWFSLSIFIGYLFVNMRKKGFNLKTFRIYFFDLLFLFVFFTLRNSIIFSLLYIAVRQTIINVKRITIESWEGVLYKRLTSNPAVFFMSSFIFIIFVGAVLLSLSISNTSGESTSFIDALFTSTSATCVTGLVLYDTGLHFSLFGQIVILVLIQIGGLGIMTISTSFAIFLGQRLTLRSEQMMQNVVGQTNKSDSFILIKNIVVMTLLFEAIGAVSLYFVFKGHDYSINPIYNAIFHSVSAFCNAGFSLYSNSFVVYMSNPILNLTITGLIIIGGLGFSVIIDSYRYILSKKRNKMLSLHTKLVLITTTILIVVGTILYFISEYNETMHNFSLKDRIWASFFQSVTTRTAGFNTIDISSLSNASVALSILLMFIGASPGSTGGGIKTTTFALIILSVYSLLMGRKNVFVFRRKIMETDISKVLSLLAMAVAFVFVSVFLLTLFERNLSFSRLIFEAISAFGTVGLSMNTTPELSFAGKLIIIFMMYLGRVGPLTVIFALSETRRISDFIYIEEKVSIG